MNSNSLDFELKSKDSLTKLALSYGGFSWSQLTSYIKTLPYGRNKNRTDLSLVLTEKKGTCSSKHAFLKSIADYNNIPNVDLIIGIYKMNELNTPNIGRILTENNLNYIPEAHCYLRINGARVDLTTADASIDKIEKEILEEKEIEPLQVGHYKIDYHQKFLTHWIKENRMEYSFDHIWSIREKCIKRLSNLSSILNFK